MLANLFCHFRLPPRYKSDLLPSGTPCDVRRQFPTFQNNLQVPSSKEFSLQAVPKCK